MNYEDLIPYVAPYVGNCPRNTLVHHIRLAVIEFCRRTHVWNEQLADISTINGTFNYSLGLPDGSELVKIFEADIGTVINALVLNAARAKRELARKSTSTFAWTPDMVSLSVNPPSSVDGDIISVEVSLKPSLASTSFPDEVGNQYGQDIGHGAAASLLRMPKVDWRDPQAAADENTLFEQAIARASRQRTKGFANGGGRAVRLY